MIELVFEIRRRVNADTKPGIKLANPDLLNELGAIYHESKDTILKTLIKELLTTAGEEWPKLLEEPATAGKSTVKVYRGQTSLEAKSEPEPAAAGSGRPKARYYRGVKIA